MGLQMEKILKQIEVGLNPQKSFTKMDEDRDVENGVWGQVMHLNPPMENEAPKEIRNGKTEASKNMWMKNNRSIHPLMRKGFTIGSPPIDHVSGLEKMLLYKTKHMEIDTLTRSPPVGFRSVFGSFANLPLPGSLLGRHGSEEKMILSCFTLGASGG